MKLKKAIMILLSLLVVFLILSISIVQVNAEEDALNILVKEESDIEAVKKELHSIDNRIEFSEIPEIKLLKARKISKKVKEKIETSQDIESFGQMPDIFIEDNRLTSIESGLENIQNIEQAVNKKSSDNFEILDQLAWYKDVMTSNGSSLDISDGKGVKIGLIDSGIDIHHPIFSSALDIANGKSFVDGDSSITDFNGHGTMVAGIITQISPKAVITPYKVLTDTDGESFWVLEAMIQAVNDGQNILNISLGTYKYENISGDNLIIEAFERAVEYASSHEVIIVSSSGNAGINLDQAYEETTIRHLPADIPGVLSISSITFEKKFASYSNSSNNNQFTAPGGEYTYMDGYLDLSKLIYSSYPTNLDNMLSAIGIPQGYMFSAGTSLSVPNVTAVIACYYSYYKNMNGEYPTILRTLNDISLKVLDLGENGKDSLFGYGLPQIIDSYSLISDTVSPVGAFKEARIEVNTYTQARAFVTNVKDNSGEEVMVTYDKIPNFSKLGNQDIYIRLEDISGNSTLISGEIIIEDTIPPVGELKSNLRIQKGEQINPESFIVSIFDNYDSDLVTFSFFNEIDMNHIGIQDVSIELSDYSGNKTVLTSKLEIVDTIEESDLHEKDNNDSKLLSEKDLKLTEKKLVNKSSNKYLPDTSEIPNNYCWFGVLLLLTALYLVKRRLLTRNNIK